VSGSVRAKESGSATVSATASVTRPEDGVGVRLWCGTGAGTTLITGEGVFSALACQSGPLPGAVGSGSVEF
jgi:hypothetical protein